MNTQNDQGGTGFRMPAGAHAGDLALRVTDLAAATDFYGRLVGFRVGEESQGEARLLGRSEHETVLRLIAEPDARGRAPRSAGLFHAAFRYPDRRELASAVLRLARQGYPLDGAADHLVSDAIYLRDPGGNGVELYTDKPRSQWPRNGGEIAMGTEPLDVVGLLREGTDAQGTGTVELGHVHLQVTDIPRSEQFYSGLLGFDVTQRTFPGALFLSAGGYHHHIGMNVWSTRRGRGLDPGALGLVEFTVRTGDARAVGQIRLRLEAANVPVELRGDDPLLPVLFVRDPDNIGITISV